MQPQNPPNRARRRCRPGLESLEGRDLLSSHPLGPSLPGKHYPAPDVQQFVPILYPPGTPQPTAAEVSRESFIAKGYGTYTVGPGRFDTQSLTIHGFGKPMTSNLSRRFHFQYEITEPVNPSARSHGRDELGRRKLSSELSPPDPRLHRTHRKRG